MKFQKELAQKFLGCISPSKVILSSFKGDLELIEQYPKLGLGGATIKTVMPKKRVRNPRPRMKTEKERMYDESTGNVEDYESIFNRMGLPRPGAKTIKKSLIQSDIFSLYRPIGISIGGDTIKDLNVFNTMHEVEAEIRIIQKKYFIAERVDQA
jgi:dihydroorotate dehydrogenase